MLGIFYMAYIRKDYTFAALAITLLLSIAPSTVHADESQFDIEEAYVSIGPAVSDEGPAPSETQGDDSATEESADSSEEEATKSFDAFRAIKPNLVKRAGEWVGEIRFIGSATQSAASWVRLDGFFKKTPVSSDVLLEQASAKIAAVEDLDTEDFQELAISFKNACDEGDVDLARMILKDFAQKAVDADNTTLKKVAAHLDIFLKDRLAKAVASGEELGLNQHDLEELLPGNDLQNAAAAYTSEKKRMVAEKDYEDDALWCYYKLFASELKKDYNQFSSQAYKAKKAQSKHNNALSLIGVAVSALYVRYTPKELHSSEDTLAAAGYDSESSAGSELV